MRKIIASCLEFESQLNFGQFYANQPFRNAPFFKCLIIMSSLFFRDGPYFFKCSGTEKVPQRTFATKISPNFRVNYQGRFASKPLFYLVMTGNPFELFRKFFGAVRALFWLWGCGNGRRLQAQNQKSFI